MANRDLLAIGTSAGGVEALHYLAQHFPQRFPAAVVVTIHLPSNSRSSLDGILSRAGPLPATFARDGEALTKGHIFIAPPGRHLIVDGDRLSLGTGPRENNVRPSVDAMLRSAALCCGHRTVATVLTGTQGDGASGLWAISQCGGATVVQDPRDAAFPEMPLNALNRANPQHIVPLVDMPALLERLVQQQAPEPVRPPVGLKYEVDVAKNGQSSMKEIDHLGRRSVLACPDCHGVMWEIDEGDIVRFRCHVGHAYTSDMMGLALDDGLRRALGSALRTLDERVALAEKLQTQATRQGQRLVADNWGARKREYEAEAKVIRQAIERADQIGAAAK